MTTWKTGTGTLITFQDIVDQASMHQGDGGRVFIGTDSFLSHEKCVFATAVCLYNEDLSVGGRYFFQKTTVKSSDTGDLRKRMTQEAQRSIDLAMTLNDCGIEDLEIHLDVSPKGSPHATASLSDPLSGYARGVGFDCKVKPDAWAAQVADKHSK
jgi:predicted RNase H-related nuclease YkuK (DUF458 family)